MREVGNLNNSLCYISQLTSRTLQNIKFEHQNKDYEGSTFSIRNFTFRCRLGKLTPKKKGYFVAFWEKDSVGNNQAFSFQNYPNKLIVVIIDDSLSGQFVFPKEILLKKNILKSPGSKGKMAMRVYPDWETDLNTSATKTQNWQSKYFIDTSSIIDSEKLNTLYYE
ncbi:MepB family protein [Enterococcus sp. ALS3]|uniref:MepB family protein n=1 Tax=Enterococcus alishanensis TaxID=1303817 RepID=A0ABS6TH15_9ENTE|nr:MepB family protein [Enterococcus alishanensis]